MILLIVESVIMGWDLFYPFNEGKGKGNDNRRKSQKLQPWLLCWQFLLLLS